MLVNIPLQLFEMGLELSLARLKALAKFAFGMGLTQVNRRWAMLLFSIMLCRQTNHYLSMCTSMFWVALLQMGETWGLLSKSTPPVARLQNSDDPINHECVDFSAFVMLQVVLCTLAFTAFELPPNGAIGTKILQFLFNSRPDLVRNFYPCQLLKWSASFLCPAMIFLLLQIWHLYWIETSVVNI